MACKWVKSNRSRSGATRDPGLPDVAAEHAPQRLVEEVRGRVVPRDVHAPLAVNARLDLVAGRDGAAADAALVHDEAVHGRLGVRNVHVAAQGQDDARIADLAAALGVEGGLAQHHLDVLAGLRAVDGVAVGREHREDVRLLREPVIADKVDAADAEVAIPEDLGLAAAAEPGLGGGAAALPLRLHLALEGVHVDGQAALAGDVLRLLDGEAVGVVEGEGEGAGEDAATGAVGRRKGLLHDGEPLLQHAAELLLLALQHAEDESAVLEQVGVGAAHAPDHDVRDLSQERLGEAELAPEADGTAD